jgi:hypothetical protein
VAHTYDPSTQEVEEGGSVVQGQPEIHSVHSEPCEKIKEGTKKGRK